MTICGGRPITTCTPLLRMTSSVFMNNKVSHPFQSLVIVDFEDGGKRKTSRALPPPLNLK